MQRTGAPGLSPVLEERSPAPLGHPRGAAVPCHPESSRPHTGSGCCPAPPRPASAAGAETGFAPGRALVCWGSSIGRALLLWFQSPETRDAGVSGPVPLGFWGRVCPQLQTLLALLGAPRHVDACLSFRPHTAFSSLCVCVSPLLPRMLGAGLGSTPPP